MNNKNYKRVCRGCGKEEMVRKSRVNLLCKSCSKRGPLNPMSGKTREQNGSWKGGITAHNKGYRCVYLPDHPKADAKGYILEHRHVMETMIGRQLFDSEVVHHCNGDKTDNRPYNLRLFASKSDHVKFHFAHNGYCIIAEKGEE